MVRLRRVAGVRTCKARQKARKGIVLREAGITKATQSRYYGAVSLLCKIVQAADDMEDLDEQVSAWIEGQFQKGFPINTAADALSGQRTCSGLWSLMQCSSECLNWDA